MRIFVTGATGFVGKALVKELVAEEHHVIAAVRTYSSELSADVEQKLVGDLAFLDEPNALIDTLKNIDVVIHCAARVHLMDDNAIDPLTEFRKMNLKASESLAKQAVNAGVKRFIFLSSIKVNGESTEHQEAFHESDEPAPEDAYGQSKLEAERALFKLGEESSMDIVVIRPPLIYGPGVKANFANMINVIKKGIPLPFGAIANQRSMVALANLIDLIKICLFHPSAANQVFLIADGDDVSTTELLKRIAKAYKQPTRLIPVPVSIMTVFTRLIGKQNISERLFGNLQIDIEKAHVLLGWKPITTMEQQLKKMAELDKNPTQFKH